MCPQLTRYRGQASWSAWDSAHLGSPPPLFGRRQSLYIDPTTETQYLDQASLELKRFNCWDQHAWPFWSLQLGSQDFCNFYTDFFSLTFSCILDTSPSPVPIFALRSDRLRDKQGLESEDLWERTGVRGWLLCESMISSESASFLFHRPGFP